MTEIPALDKALLELEQELTEFKGLQFKLSEVRKEIDQLVEQGNSSIKETERKSSEILQTALQDIGEGYGHLTEQNQEQFQNLAGAWREQISLAEKATQGALLSTERTEHVAIKLGDLAARMHSLADSIAEVNFPLRLDKMDSSIAASLTTVLGLQTRFDIIKNDFQQLVRNLELEIESKIESLSKIVADRAAVLESRISTVSDMVQTTVRRMFLFAVMFLFLLLSIIGMGIVQLIR